MTFPGRPSSPWILCLLVAATVLLAVALASSVLRPNDRATSGAGGDGPRPRLVVTIVVDQMRADYLNRFNDLLLPPGGSNAEAGASASWIARFRAGWAT